MPAMNVPAWFNAAEYAIQKVNQMNATGYGKDWLAENGDGATEWTTALYEKHLTTFGAPVEGSNAAEMAYSNFMACNEANYGTAKVTLADINVSPNSYFDIPVYLQDLANYNNANPDAYEGAAPEGGWTMQAELDTMFNTYKVSAWEHYDANWADLLDVNPSNKFDTAKYLAARAQFMGNGATADDAVAAIKAAGLNPVQDYFANGLGMGITDAMIAVEAGDQVNPADPTWNQWSSNPIEPIATDPYDLNFVTKDIVAGDTGPYTSDAGQNTHFNASWIGVGSTLAAGDVITGGENALNSLVVDLARDWTGFKGIAVEGKPGTYDPNVTNVGRVVLNHNKAVMENGLTFDAKNISEDTVQFDLNATGTGSISLKNLSSAVDRINISNLTARNLGDDSGTAMDTTLTFANGATTAKDDALTIGLNNVCASKGNAPVKGLNGIETITLDSMGGTNNAVDISSAIGVKNVNVTGASNLSFWSNAQGVKAYDASAATGNVNMYLSNLGNSTAVTGGSGSDTVSLAGAGTTISKANWTSIEHVGFNGTGASTLNLKGVEGLQDAWINNAQNNTVTNLTADNFSVYQTNANKDGTGTTKIDGPTKGGLGNIAWISAGDADKGTTFTAKFESNATGDATIDLTGLDTLNDGSSFKFSGATGKITLRNPNALDAKATDGGYTTGVTLEAAKATALDATIDGGMKILGTDKLDKLQDITLNLTNESPTTTPNQFILSATSLKAAQNITVNAGGEDVGILAAIGSDKGYGVDLNVQDANDFVVGTMQANLGGNITANIVADGVVAMGEIKTTTNAAVNAEGDVILNITSQEGLVGLGTIIPTDLASPPTAAATDIVGGDLQLNFANVGTAEGATDAVGASGSEFTLKAMESIQYTGAEGSDYIKVASVGNGTTSIFNMGDGVDELTIDGASMTNLKNTSITTMNVDMGAGTDKLDITANTKGCLVVNINNFDGDTVGVTGASTLDPASNVADINAILEACGVGLQLPTDADGNYVAPTEEDDYDYASGVFFDGTTAFGISGQVTDGKVDYATIVILSGDNVAIDSMTVA